MHYILSFILGGSVVTLVTYLATNENPNYAGILMTFPIITVTSLLLIPESLIKRTATFGFFGALSAAVFLATFLITMNMLGMSKYPNLLISLALWFIFAYMVLHLLKT